VTSRRLRAPNRSRPPPRSPRTAGRPQKPPPCTDSRRSLDQLDEPPRGRGAVGRAVDRLLRGRKRLVGDAEGVVEDRPRRCDDRQADPFAEPGRIGRSHFEHGGGVALMPAQGRESQGAPRREACSSRLGSDTCLLDQCVGRFQLAPEEVNVRTRVEGEGKLAECAAAPRELYVEARQAPHAAAPEAAGAARASARTADADSRTPTPSRTPPPPPGRRSGLTSTRPGTPAAPSCRFRPRPATPTTDSRLGGRHRSSRPARHARPPARAGSYAPRLAKPARHREQRVQEHSASLSRSSSRG
jgi:hypothetical protein